MLAQTPMSPPTLQRIATTPVLASERPAGFPHVKVTRLAADRRIHTLGVVRIDFSNGRDSESASFALMRTNAAARRLAHTEATVRTGGLFHTQAVFPVPPPATSMTTRPSYGPPRVNEHERFALNVSAPAHRALREGGVDERTGDAAGVAYGPRRTLDERLRLGAREEEHELT